MTCVSDRSRYRQFHLRAGALRAPDCQLSADRFGALADARQSPVSLARALLEDLAVDALAIIANSQPEELAVVGDFGLDAAGVRVVKGVSQVLARNPVDLVLQDRRQGLPRSFHSHLECRRFALRTGRSREFLSRGS